MSDGRWNRQLAEEINQAYLTRERILRVNLVAPGPEDASGFAGDDPSTTANIKQHGPHFVLSPKTQDGRPTSGFEWSLMNYGANVAFAAPAAGGFTVTVWRLVANLQVSKNSPAAYTAFEPVTGVGYRQLYRTFDVNACALRFQITNAVGGVGVVELMVAEL